MNKSLLDSDIVSEIGKAIDPVAARNATAYRQAFGRYTITAVSVQDVVCSLIPRSENIELCQGSHLEHPRGVDLNRRDIGE